MYLRIAAGFTERIVEKQEVSRTRKNRCAEEKAAH